MTMQPEQLAAMLGARLPIAATVTGLSLVEFRPVRQLHFALLSNK
jgi:DNA-binding IclR family transcriptional regulator